MHYLNQVIEEVDKTHPHLGNPVAVAMLAIKAKKLLLIVSPRGCGKSRVTSFVGLSYPNPMLEDRLSVAGLAALGGELNGYQGVLIVDDIAKTQTPYARITTVTTLAELVYSHYCKSHLQGSNFEISDFNGAALVNIQPILLKEIVKSTEWEASMMDKSMRYYHLYRPQEPNPEPPKIELDWGAATADVSAPELKGKLADELKSIGKCQWGLSRLREHIADLLRASAALDRRGKVTLADYRLLTNLLAPMRIESLVTDKQELEAQRYLASNQLAILTEFFTYGSFTLSQLAGDYHLSQGQCYKIMGRYTKEWVVVSKNPTTYAPTDELRKRLKGVKL